MLWVTDTERVIDDQHHQPYSMTLEKWKARKEVVESLNDRSWAYHGMSAYARKTRRSELNRCTICLKKAATDEKREERDRDKLW